MFKEKFKNSILRGIDRTLAKGRLTQEEADKLKAMLDSSNDQGRIVNLAAGYLTAAARQQSLIQTRDLSEQQVQYLFMELDRHRELIVSHFTDLAGSVRGMNRVKLEHLMLQALTSGFEQEMQIIEEEIIEALNGQQ